MRYASKVDESQKGIVTGLRGMGCSVEHLARIGKGAPDLLVGYMRVNFLFEIKTPGSAHAKAYGTKGNSAKTAAAQREWYESWQGVVYRVESFEEAREIIATHPTVIAALRRHRALEMPAVTL